MNKPRFILSKDKVINNYEKIKNLGALVSYSLKTNYHVGKVLEKHTDCYFGVHNKEELERLNERSRAQYFLLANSDEEIKQILDSGVKWFIIELEEDLEKLLKITDKKINILFRINIKENTIFSGRYFVYGMDSKKVNGLIEKYHRDEKIDQFGIHFHRKTQNVSEWNLKKEIIEFLTEDNLKKINVINIGGGIPGKYKNTNDKAVDLIFSKIKDLIDFFDGNIVVEPGRYIASSAVELECEIVAIENNTIHVYASIFQGALDAVIANFKLLVKGEKESGEKFLIKGSSPASEDIFRYEAYLDKPKVGDKITFLNAGAYNYRSDFCSLEKIETVVI